MSTSVGERMLAVVAQWNERGFGFVEFADGTRAYCHNKACNGEHLQVGETITAVPRPDNRDSQRLCATEVRRGPFGDEVTVIEWNEDSGVGTVIADDTFLRATVHVATLEAAGGGFLELGERLRVVITADERDSSKHVVTEVKDHLGMGTMDVQTLLAQLPSYAIMQQMASAASAPPQQLAKPADILRQAEGQLASQDQLFASMSQGVAPDGYKPAQGKPEPGTVQDWSDEGGFGFLSMDDGRRVYIHRSNLTGETYGGLTIGQRLRVRTKNDARNAGKWCVDEVYDESALVAFDAAQRQEQQLALADASAGSGGAAKEWKLDLAASASSGLLDRLRPKRGVVSDWSEENGSGFLLMGDGQRVYLHRMSFGGSGDLKMGTELQVTTKPDNRNVGRHCVNEVLSIDGVVFCGLDGVEPEEAPAKRQRIAMG